ncbi:MAG: TonB family protein [Bryobacteraceae bacterium]
MDRDRDFSLWLDRADALETPRRGWAAVGSLLVHVLIVAFLLFVPLMPPEIRNAPEIRPVESVTLVIPPKLTQTAPNTTKPSMEVNLQGLLAEARQQAQRVPGTTRPAAPKAFETPPTPAPTPAPKPEFEAPKVDAGPRDIGELQARNLPGVGVPSPVAPPQIEAQEKPKLAFEKPGADTGRPTDSGVGRSRIPVPQRSPVEEAVRQVARGGGGGLAVGDLGEGTGGLGESLNSPPRVRNGSRLELLSDPQGVDFQPYLIRILSAVRRNWFAVIPESARLGRRGKVLIQFAISKDGSVPKLVISGPSGTEALDRAAVAGISASNPFPPLPDQFKGQQIRLQFTFMYNMGAQ